MRQGPREGGVRRRWWTWATQTGVSQGLLDPARRSGIGLCEAGAVVVRPGARRKEVDGIWRTARLTEAGRTWTFQGQAMELASCRNKATVALLLWLERLHIKTGEGERGK